MRMHPGQNRRAHLHQRMLGQAAGFAEDLGITAAGDNIPLALLGWVAGCTAIWSSLFAVGMVLYGRMPMALMLFATFVVSGTALTYVVRRLWSGSKAEEAA